MFAPNYRPYVAVGEQQPSSQVGGGCGFLGFWPKSRPYAGERQPEVGCAPGMLSGLFGFLAPSVKPYRTIPAPAPAQLPPADLRNK